MQIKIYSTEFCHYCRKTKAWLEQNEIVYEEIILDNQEKLDQFLVDCPGQTMVPQILIDGDLIPGGYTGLMGIKETLLEKINLQAP